MPPGPRGSAGLFERSPRALNCVARSCTPIHRSLAPGSTINLVLDLIVSVHLSLEPLEHLQKHGRRLRLPPRQGRQAASRSTGRCSTGQRGGIWLWLYLWFGPSLSAHRQPSRRRFAHECHTRRLVIDHPRQWEQQRSVKANRDRCAVERCQRRQDQAVLVWRSWRHAIQRYADESRARCRPADDH